MNKNKNPDNKNTVKTIFYIPNATKLDLQKCDNLKLIFDKYIEFETETKDPKNIIQKAKSKVFEKALNFSKESCQEMIKMANKTQESITSEKIQLTTKSRLVVGLGTSSILEVSMKLHHIYGIPYIPSSAVKGILRAYNILKVSGKDLQKYKDVEKKLDSLNVLEAEKDQKNSSEEDKKILKLAKLFGNQNYKGELIILDAYPDTCPKLEKDITNVHYPEYYREAKPPSENQSPNPVVFLTIKSGTKFNFYFKNTNIYKQLTGEDIKKDLIEATKYLGLGAKSSVGYGLLQA